MVVGEFTSEADLLIIGGGPGGYTAAFRAAELGIQTTIVQATEFLGGVCLHEGCIPSKTLLYITELIEQASASEQMGVTFGKPKIDPKKIRAWKNSVIKKLSGGLDAQCKRLGIERITGTARFEDSKNVAIQGGDVPRIKFRHAIIATGSSSIRLRGIEVDSPRVMHARDALELDTIPKNMLVIGGGYIGMELGSVYAGLGTEVTVVEMLPNIMAGADQDLVRPLTKRMKSVLAEISVKTKVTAMKELKDAIEVSFEGEQIPKRKKFEKVLICVGRTPNTGELGLENTKVQVDRGAIQVNERMQTSDSRIYAIGDVAPGPMLAHKASYEGRIAADVIAGHDSVSDARAIPAVVFTDPEIAWCGLTESEAKQAGTKVIVKKIPWGASGRATAMGRTDGLTKILFDPESQRVLGVAICGPHAGEMIAEGTLALEMGAVATDIASTIHPHPTLSELMGEVADMMELAGMKKKP